MSIMTLAYTIAGMIIRLARLAMRAWILVLLFSKSRLCMK